MIKQYPVFICLRKSKQQPLYRSYSFLVVPLHNRLDSLSGLGSMYLEQLFENLRVKKFLK